MPRELPILTFHDLAEDRSSISVPPAVFECGLARLAEGGWRALDLAALAEMLRRGEPVPDRSFVLTFDDGYQSAYRVALPALQRHRFAATVFLAVGGGAAADRRARLASFGGRTMLSWQEIREMDAAGVAFGAHTQTHPDLTRLPPDEAEAEICRSKAILEGELGHPVSAFAYPYGRHNARVRALTRPHFTCACSDRLGLVRRSSDLYALKRVDAWYVRTDALFSLIGTRGFRWYLLARGASRTVRRLLRRSPVR